MAGRTAVLAVRIIGDARSAVSSLGQVEQRSGRLAGVGKKVAAGLALGGAAAGAFAIKAIGMAGDLEQSGGAVDTVFAKSAKGIQKFGDTAATSVGLTKNEFNELATLMGSQLKNGGTSVDQLGGKTQSLIKLGADLSSMYGGDTKTAVEALSSALKGERDPIEKYGVSLNQAKIDAEAAALGFKKVGGSLSSEGQQAATLSLIMKQTKDAHGNFARETDTLAHQQQILKATIGDTSAKLGQVFLPIATKAFSYLNTNVVPVVLRVVDAVKLLAAGGTKVDFVKKLGLDPASGAGKAILATIAGVQKLVSFIKGLSTGQLAGLGATVGTVLLAISPLGGVIRKIGPLIASVVSKLGGFRVILGVLTGPVGLIVGALVALYVTSVPFRNAVNDLIKLIGTLAGDLGAKLGPIFAQITGQLLPAIGAAFAAVVPIIGQLLSAVVPLVGALVAKLAPVLIQFVTTLIPQLVAPFRAVAPLIQELVTAVIGLVTAIAVRLIPIIKATLPTVVTIFGAIRTVITGVLNVIIGVVNVFTGILTGDWSKAWAGIKQIVSGAWSVVKGVVTAALGIIKVAMTVAMGLLGAIWSTAWNGIKAAASAAWDGIKALISGAINAVKSKISSDINSIKSNVSNGWNSIKGAADRAWNGIKSGISNAWNGIKSAISSGISGAVGYVQALPGKMVAALGDLGSLLSGAGRKIIEGLISGITSKIGDIKSLLSSVTNLIPDWKGPAQRDKKLLTPAGKLIVRGLIGGIVSELPALRSKLGAITSEIERSVTPTITPTIAPRLARGIAGDTSGSPGSTRQAPTVVNITVTGPVDRLSAAREIEKLLRDLGVVIGARP